MSSESDHQRNTQLLNDLFSCSDLTTEKFEDAYATILRECQKAGECKYDWEAIRHLLALRFQGLYSEFRASEPTPSSTEDQNAWMCAACRETAKDATATPHCRRSEVDEEPQDVRYRRMMHSLIAFYKPPFTFQRMCDLLLDARRYCKSTNKFLLSFSKLVCGISCDAHEDAFNSHLNWYDSKDMTLGLKPMNFVTREEDEFTMDGFVTGTNGSETRAPFAATHNVNLASATAATAAAAPIVHAILPPQQYRVGMTSDELSEAALKEANAKAALEANAAQAATSSSSSDASHTMTDETSATDQTDHTSQQNGVTPMEMAE